MDGIEGSKETLERLDVVGRVSEVENEKIDWPSSGFGNQTSVVRGEGPVAVPGSEGNVGEGLGSLGEEGEEGSEVTEDVL